MPCKHQIDFADLQDTRSEIGREPGAEHVLAGSVLQAGDPI
jgi:hypothetical protein